MGRTEKAPGGRRGLLESGAGSDATTRVGSAATLLNAATSVTCGMPNICCCRCQSATKSDQAYNRISCCNIVAAQAMQPHNTVRGLVPPSLGQGNDTAMVPAVRGVRV